MEIGTGVFLRGISSAKNFKFIFLKTIKNVRNVSFFLFNSLIHCDMKKCSSASECEDQQLCCFMNSRMFTALSQAMTPLLTSLCSLSVSTLLLPLNASHFLDCAHPLPIICRHTCHKINIINNDIHNSWLLVPENTCLKLWFQGPMLPSDPRFVNFKMLNNTATHNYQYD